MRRSQKPLARNGGIYGLKPQFRAKENQKSKSNTLAPALAPARQVGAGDTLGNNVKEPQKRNETHGGPNGSLQGNYFVIP